METERSRFSRLDPDARHAQLVEMARGLFAERPFAAVSMSDVAAAAGVTRALIHHYFPHKSDLYRAVIQSIVDTGPEVIRTDLGLPVDEMVGANVSAALDFAAANRETMSAIAQPGAFDHDPEVAAVIDSARESLVDRMLTNHLGTTDAPPQVRLLLRGYLGLFQATTFEWLIRGRATRDEVQVMLTHTLLAMMTQTLPALMTMEPASSVQ